MKTLLLITLGFALSCKFLYAQSPAWEWAIPVGAIVKATAPLNDGSAIIGGTYSEPITILGQTLTSRGGSDIFLARVSANGTWLWVLSGGGTSEDMLSAVSAQNDFVSIAGTFSGVASFGTDVITANGSSDIFVCRLTIQGSWVWALRAGSGGPDEASGLAMLPNGNLAMTGSFTGVLPIGPDVLISRGNQDIYLSMMSSAGTWLWAQRIGGPGYDLPYALDITPIGNLVLAGQFSDSVEVGTVHLRSAGGSDILVACYDYSGNPRWATRTGGLGEDRAYAISSTNYNRIAIGGIFYGTVDFGSFQLTSFGGGDAYVGILTLDGQWQMVRRGGGIRNDAVEAITNNVDGSIVVAGSYTETAAFGTHQIFAGSAGRDSFVGQLSPNGEWNWIQSFASGSSTNYAYSLSVSAGRLYVGGFSSGGLTLGALPVIRRGGYVGSFVLPLFPSATNLALVKDNLMAYPNPAAGSFRISGLDANKPYNIINVNGLTIKNEFGKEEINHHLAPGHYIIKQGTKSTRLVSI